MNTEGQGLSSDSSGRTAITTDTSSQSASPAERFARALTLVPELSDVEEIVRRAFHSDVTLMREIPAYLLGLGGKRIRPVLALLCAKALGMHTISGPLLDVAAGIELIHMATLLHDDIIDNSPIRRHQPSPLAKFGVNATLLSGDFLLTRAFGLCARLDHTIIEATEEACIELVEGEALETPLFTDTHTVETSLTIARRKTAALFRLAAFCGAHTAHATDSIKKSMSEFGENLGIAFQILDDILDVTSNEATLGKRPGLDLIERKPSLVNVLWLESGAPNARHLLTAPNGSDESAYVEASLKELHDGAPIRRAKEIAHSYAARARSALTSTGATETEAGMALVAVIDFAIDRVR